MLPDDDWGLGASRQLAQFKLTKSPYRFIAKWRNLNYSSNFVGWLLTSIARSCDTSKIIFGQLYTMHITSSLFECRLCSYTVQSPELNKVSTSFQIKYFWHMALPAEIHPSTQDDVHICVLWTTGKATAIQEDRHQGRKERMVRNGNYGTYSIVMPIRVVPKTPTLEIDSVSSGFPWCQTRWAQ